MKWLLLIVLMLLLSGCFQVSEPSFSDSLFSYESFDTDVCRKFCYDRDNKKMCQYEIELFGEKHSFRTEEECLNYEIYKCGEGKKIK